MTTLYKPVLIESAEQAEALPAGTVAVRDYFNEGDDYHHYDCARKIDLDTWFQILNHDEFANGLVLGWTALVPIEAEEVPVIASGGLERDQHGATVFNHTPDGPRRDYRRTEFHTPWEEV